MGGESSAGAQSVTLNRVFDSPRELLFRAWTVPDLLSRWWWPERFQTTYAVDLRPRGEYRFQASPIAGMPAFAVTGEFIEIEDAARLVYSWRWEGLDPKEGSVTTVTVGFADLGGSSAIKLTHAGFANDEETANHIQGWNDCLDRLESAIHEGAFS